MELCRLYGKKQSVAEEDAGHTGPQAGKNFATLSSELNVAEATAKVYGIDCLAAGADLVCIFTCFLE